MIEIRDVVKAYGRTVVVDGVSLTLPVGGVTSIIGPNGAGKSTLLSMVARLLPTDVGTIRVDGLDVATADGRTLARRLAVLRQDNHTTVRLTVRDLVGFGRHPHNRGRPTAEDLAHVDRALGLLELDGLADRFLDELSGGQRQRAAIAMTICQDTEYLLLDEPLNSLDIPHAVGLMRLVRRAAGELGKTVVMVVHDINFASCASDLIVAMKEGRIVAQGSPTEIVTPEALETVYGSRFSVREIDGRRLAFYYD